MNSLERIKVNNVIYECFCINASNGFYAILKSDNISEIKNVFTDIDEIIVMNNIGQVIKSVTGLSEITRIEEFAKYYADDEGVLHSAIAITLKSIDINEKVKQLEERLNVTVNEADMTIDEYRKYRIDQSKSVLKDYLETHPITSTAHGGVKGIYSITEEKQNEMVRNYFSYQMNKQLGLSTKLTWNETGKSCVEWTEEEFIMLSSQIRARATSLASYQRKIEENINNMNDKAEIAKIVFDYDSVPIVSEM